MKDFGLIDLPFPLRKMSVSPVGTLTSRRDRSSGTTTYELLRGVLAFPSLGDQVLLPTPEQVEAIVGANTGHRRIRIGASPLAANATIAVDPDKLFGRHLAVLGNTGSGKSCTVAGLIRWSLDAAQLAIKGDKAHIPNARFIVLDSNGEYAKAFADREEATRVFRVPPVMAGERPLDVPAWLWNGPEWTAVAHAQPGAQRPLLLQGLRELKSGHSEKIPRSAIVRRYLQSYATRVSAILTAGTQAFAGGAREKFECARLLESIIQDTLELGAGLDEQVGDQLVLIANVTEDVLGKRRDGKYFKDFTIGDLEAVRGALEAVIDTLPDLDSLGSISEDSPLFFDLNLLGEHLDRVAAGQGGNLAAFISTLGLRIRGMLADKRLGAVIGRDPPTSFDQWLKDYVGDNHAANGQIAIVDLSLVPSEVVHIVVSVLARLIFEALQRYRRDHPLGLSLPTVLVLEEAHNFVRRASDDEGQAANPAQLCRQVFERIAREGRKFGLGLVLSSQRPFELSPTVLAQCNTFLLHRIVNDADQNLIARLVPDNVGGLLKELPSLPSRQAILLGWATPLPVLVEIDELPEEHRPRSADPDYWDVWIHERERDVDWTKIAGGWAT